MQQKGFTLIELMIVIAIIAIIAAIAIPNLIEARKGANESAAIATLRTLVTVQTLFRDGDKDQDGQANYATSLAVLSSTLAGNLIDGVLGTGTKQGYGYSVAAKAGGDLFGWTGEATPISTNQGNRRFWVDEVGVIRFSAGNDPTSASTVIGG